MSAEVSKASKLGTFAKLALGLARRGARMANPALALRRAVAREKLGYAVNRGWAKETREACEALGEQAATAGHPDGTPWIILASGRGHDDCLAILLEAGADPNASERDGTPAVAVAAQYGHAGCVEMLLKAGAHPGRAGPQGKSPLWLMAEVDSARATVGREDYPRCARLLAQAGAAVDEVGQGGLTPLMLAAQQGRSDLALELLELGASFTLTTPQGLTLTAFDVASMTGRHECAQALESRHEALRERKLLERDAPQPQSVLGRGKGARL